MTQQSQQGFGRIDAELELLTKRMEQMEADIANMQEIITRQDKTINVYRAALDWFSNGTTLIKDV